MIIRKNGQFQFSLLNLAFLTTIRNAVIAVNIYAAVWEYTNHSILKGVDVMCPQSRTPTNMIISIRSRTERKLSVLNISSPEIFDLKYKTKEIRNWLNARIASNFS